MGRVLLGEVQAHHLRGILKANMDNESFDIECNSLPSFKVD